MSESTTSKINFSDNIADTYTFRVSNLSRIDLSTTANIFNIFYDNTSSTFNLSDNTISILSPIQVIPNNIIDFSTNSRITLKVNSVANNTITFDDNTTSLLNIKNQYSSTIDFSDETTLFYRHSELSDNSTINLSDNTIIDVLFQAKKKIFKNKVFPMLGTTHEVIYTATKETLIMNISICNRLTTEIKVYIVINNGIDIFLAKDVIVGESECYIMNNNNKSPMQLNVNDELILYTDTDNSADVYIALLESE